MLAWVPRRSVSVVIFALMASLGAMSVDVAAAAPAAKHGGVDLSFGESGRTLSPVPAALGDDAAGQAVFGVTEGLKGEIYAFTGGVIAAFSPRGVPDKRFGQNGYLYLQSEVGYIPLRLGAEIRPGFVLADVAIDSKGRIVVAGTTKVAIPGPGSEEGELATVRRYLPNGNLDPGFGSGGVVIGTLGLPLVLNWQEYSTKFQVPPEMNVTGVEIDSHDRPVLAGSARTARASCDLIPILASEGFVARLTPSGALDGEFANGGSELVGGYGSTAQHPVIGNRDSIAVTVAGDQCRSPHSQALVRLGENGGPDPAFGASGTSSIAFGSVADLAFDQSQRILVFGERATAEQYGEGNGPFTKLARIQPSGAADPAFRKRGSTEVEPPDEGSFTALTVDGRDRPLLAGWSPASSKRAVRRFAIERRTRAGKLDQSFGTDGLVTIGFGRYGDAEGRDILVDRRGRLVVGGFVSQSHGVPNSNSFGLTRYLPAH